MCTATARLRYQLCCFDAAWAGGVAAVLAMLLREPEGCPPAVAGRVSCVALGCPAVMTTNLADACRSYVTSLVLRCAAAPPLRPGSL